MYCCSTYLLSPGHLAQRCKPFQSSGKSWHELPMKKLLCPRGDREDRNTFWTMLKGEAGGSGLEGPKTCSWAGITTADLLMTERDPNCRASLFCSGLVMPVVRIISLCMAELDICTQCQLSLLISWGGLSYWKLFSIEQRVAGRLDLICPYGSCSLPVWNSDVDIRHSCTIET